MSEPRSLADLAVRALTPEQQRQVREQNLLSVMPQDAVMGFLATTNHQFRRLVRKVMILRNALVRTPEVAHWSDSTQTSELLGLPIEDDTEVFCEQSE